MYYLNCFLFYSIFGYFFESTMNFFRNRKFSSGILFGMWTPIYGVGCVIILLLSNYLFYTLNIQKWREVIIVFFVVMFILTFIEWLSGNLIERFLHVVFWNYSEFYYHIGKYIALEVSLFWGFSSLVFIYLINPFFRGFILKIPNAITYVFLILMVVDFIFTFIKYKRN